MSGQWPYIFTEQGLIGFKPDLTPIR